MSIGDKAETVGWILVGVGFLIVSVFMEQHNRQLRKQADRLARLERQHAKLSQETHEAFHGWHAYFFGQNQGPQR